MTPESTIYDIRADGESTGPAGTYRVWQHNYHSGNLDIEPCDSLQEALESAHAWSDIETGEFDSIEGPAGLVPEAAVEAWIRAKDQQAAEARRARAESDEGKTLYQIHIRHPDGKRSAEWETAKTEDEAREIVAELNLPGRTRITETHWSYSASGLYHRDTRRVVKDWDED